MAIFGTSHQGIRTNRVGNSASGLKFLVDLDSVAVAVGHIDFAVLVHVDRHRAVEAALGFDVLDRQLQLSFNIRVGVKQGLAPLGHSTVADEHVFEPTGPVEDLDPVVQPIAHVNIAVCVHGDAIGAVELPLVSTRGAKGHQEIAFSVKFLDPVVAPIGDVNIPRNVDSDAPRHVELPFSISQSAPFGYELTIGG